MAHKFSFEVFYFKGESVSWVDDFIRRRKKECWTKIESSLGVRANIYRHVMRPLIT